MFALVTLSEVVLYPEQALRFASCSKGEVPRLNTALMHVAPWRCSE